MKYTLNTHLHNFAVWTAARAVSRNFTTTAAVRGAIECTNLRELIDTDEEFTLDSFDEYHRSTARSIVSFFQSLGGATSEKTSYGRAAKIIAVYIKTIATIRDGRGSLAKFAHPPIDRILLTNLHKEYPLLNTNNINWTQLDEHSYFDLVERLRTIKVDYFWELERFWSPER